jgi:hypothetical protein
MRGGWWSAAHAVIKGALMLHIMIMLVPIVMNLDNLAVDFK